MKRVTIILVILIVIITLIIFFLRRENTQTTMRDTDQVTNIPTDIPTPSLAISPANTTTSSINDGIDEFVGKISSALQARNASQFQSLLVNNDIVFDSISNGITPSTVSKADMLSWL